MSEWLTLLVDVLILLVLLEGRWREGWKGGSGGAQD